MTMWIISIIVFAAAYGAYVLLKGNKASAQAVSQPAVGKTYNGPGLTEEELAVIAAVIKAYESEAFEITSINEVGSAGEPEKVNAEIPKSYQKSSGAWTQTARREYQRRL